MADVTIQVKDNGPLRVTGTVQLIDAEGNAYEEKAAFSLCRCGHSEKKPYCDGSHRTADFQSVCRADT